MFMNILCLISAIAEIVLKVSEKSISTYKSSELLFKLFCELVVSIVSIIVLHNYKKRVYLSSIIKNIFEEVKEKGKEYLIYLIDLISNNEMGHFNK